LDRGTSGLMLVAKCSYLHDQLRRALHTENLHREYLGIAEGFLSPPVGTIDLPIGRDETSLLRRCIREDGLPALTKYETVQTTHRFSLLRLLPVTGRTHQLRLHLSAMSHSLAGDWLYGTEDRALITRPALHSAFLRFTHPITGESLSFSAPLPADMEALLK
ncbi:MAG: RluA family pseudouridine synthase, partial [Oscillospiraceae bacterium]|nr:RluA family pseudouridine synthase [Oscillospiraceae bacterium]